MDKHALLKELLPDHEGKQVVLYFYPKDSTPGCTIEAKDFRDAYQDFLALDTLIFGVSRDSMKSHDSFSTKCGLPFPLISDADERLCRHFNVLKEKSMFGKKVRGIVRSTFLIDKTGAIKQEWRDVSVPGHVQAVLALVRQGS